MVPFVSLTRTKGWNEGAIDGANLLLANGNAETFMAMTTSPVISESKCLQLFRLQLPQTRNSMKDLFIH